MTVLKADVSNYPAFRLLDLCCDFMQLTPDIPDDVVERAKRVAASESIALDMLAEDRFRLALQQHEQPKAGPITPVVVGGKGTVPDLSWTHLGGLLYGS